MSQSAKVHFEITHGQSMRKFEIKTNHGQHQFTIAPATITGQCREGAQPPTHTELQDKVQELDESQASQQRKHLLDSKTEKKPEVEEDKGSGEKRYKKKSRQQNEKGKKGKRQDVEQKEKIKHKGKKYKKKPNTLTTKVKDHTEGTQKVKEKAEAGKEKKGKKPWKKYTPRGENRKASRNETADQAAEIKEEERQPCRRGSRIHGACKVEGNH